MLLFEIEQKIIKSLSRAEKIRLIADYCNISKMGLSIRYLLPQAWKRLLPGFRSLLIGENCK